MDAKNVFQLLKPAPSDFLPLTGKHFLNYLEQHHQLGTECKCRHPRGTSHSTCVYCDETPLENLRVCAYICVYVRHCELMVNMARPRVLICITKILQFFLHYIYQCLFSSEPFDFWQCQHICSICSSPQSA